MFEQEASQWYDLMMKGMYEGWFTPAIVDGHVVNTAIPSPPDRRDWGMIKIAPPPVDIPDRVSQEHLVPEVLNQHHRGTCVGKTNSSAVGMGHNALSRLPEGGFSTLFNYSLCKQYDGFPTTEGTFPRVSCKIANKYGTLPAVKLPYDTENVTPQITTKMLQEAAEYRTDAYARARDTEEIEWAMASKKKARISILVAENFVKWDGKGLIGPPKGRVYGFHEMAVSEYDRRAGYIRGPNSWGTAWGKNGYYELSYEFLHWESADIPNFPALREAWAMQFAEEGDQPSYELVIEFWIGKPIALVNGKPEAVDPKNPSVAPLIKWSRSFLPARFIAEKTGADEILWDGKERKVTLKYRRG